jgi:hypothetical protein
MSAARRQLSGWRARVGAASLRSETCRRCGVAWPMQIHAIMAGKLPLGTMIDTSGEATT